MSLSREYQLLLKLLRIAIGTESEPAELFPANVNWQELIRLSYEQKVSALAVDGFMAIRHNINYEPTSAITNWIKDAARTDDSYSYYVTTLTTLCQIFASNHLSPVILKGYGLSLNYERPSHRGAGDIDIFILDENRKPATEQALNLITDIFRLPTTKEPHHYRFDFKGIEVELHYDTTNAYFNTVQERYIVDRLTQLLPDNIIPCPGIENAYIPNATFNALYLTRHTLGHFYTASGNLRQYTDWVTFLRSHHNEIDWNEVQNELEKSNMKPYFDGLNTMLNHWLNLDTTHIPMSTPNLKTEQYTLQDMQDVVENGRHLHQRIHYFYSNRHKLQFISGKHWLWLLNSSIITSIVHLLSPHPDFWQQYVTYRNDKSLSTDI